MLDKKEVCFILLILLLIPLVYALGGSENTAEEVGKTLDLSSYQNLAKDAQKNEFFLTADATGTAAVSSEQVLYDASGDGMTGFVGTAKIVNGLITGGIFSANADASLLKVHNSIFDIYFDMSEGDTVEVTDTSPGGTQLDYLLTKLTDGIQAFIAYDQSTNQTFTATANDSLFLMYNENKFEITDGVMTFVDEEKTQILEAGEDRSKVEVTNRGIKKAILYKNKTFSQKSDLLNISILNDKQKEYTICTEETEDCQATLVNNILKTQGEVTLLQDGEMLYQSLHPSEIIKVDFNTKAFTSNNLNPNNGPLLYVFYENFIILETTEGIFKKFTSSVSSSILNSYTSELAGKTVNFQDNSLSYKNYSAFAPKEGS